MSFTELLRGATLLGPAPSVLNAASCTKLGRALGTLVRRRAGGGAKNIVVARGEDGLAFAVRDGLTRGLVLTGHHVKDIGTVPSDVFTFALRHLGATAGVVVTPANDAALSLMIFMAGRPLVGEGLQALAQLADGDDFAVGEGTLDVIDVSRAFRAAPKRDLDAESGP